MSLLLLLTLFGTYQARGAILSRDSPFFESDYLEIVKDIPSFLIGTSSGYTKYRKLSVFGPNSFPVITEDDGYAYIAAGRYGKVNIFRVKIDLGNQTSASNC